MFDIGYQELLVIAVVALLVLGPDKLPGAYRKSAQFLALMRRHADELRREFNRAMYEKAAEPADPYPPPVEPAKPTAPPDPPLKG